jgi:hypothetical protein
LPRSWQAYFWEIVVDLIDVDIPDAVAGAGLQCLIGALGRAIKEDNIPVAERSGAVLTRRVYEGCGVFSAGIQQYNYFSSTTSMSVFHTGVRGLFWLVVAHSTASCC